MSIKDDYYIKQIDSKTANDVIIKCHYTHRAASCVVAFGLYSRCPNKLVGVCIYGLPKNLESYLVGNTLKLLDREIIVSYADTKVKHVGVIYQATNFYYTGLSQQHNEIEYVEVSSTGKVIHNKSTMIRWKSTDAIEEAIKNGNTNLKAVTRSLKHRYVYFNCSKRRKKELLKKLTYPILPYPKATESVPITSTTNIFDGKRGLF